MIKTVPWIELKPGMLFMPRENFGGAVARFLVCLKTNKEKTISVYFDDSDALGCVGEPYWEAYPMGGDVGRFLVGEEEKLINEIEAELLKKEERI